MGTVTISGGIHDGGDRRWRTRGIGHVDIVSLVLLALLLLVMFLRR